MINFLRDHPFFCTSVSSCAVGFMSSTLPYLQYAALVISLVAGVISIVRNLRRKP